MCDIISTELVVIAFYFSVKMSSVTESAQIYSLLIQQHYKVSFHIRAVVFMLSCSNRCNNQMEGNKPSYCAKWYWRGGVREWEGGGKSSHRGWLVQVPQIMPGFYSIEGTLLIPPLFGGMLRWPKGPPPVHFYAMMFFLMVHKYQWILVRGEWNCKSQLCCASCYLFYYESVLLKPFNL